VNGGKDLSLRKSDVWLTVHRNSVWIRNQLDVIFVLSFISPLQVAQHVSGNHLPIFRSCLLRSVIATCWYCAVTMSGIIQICLFVWVDMFYICLVYGKSSVSGNTLHHHTQHPTPPHTTPYTTTHNTLHYHTQPTHTRFTINQTNIEHIDPHR